ncbi:hypothetical protein PENTCL1PPCAC_18659, partial [Pristionchus entomophagus]
MRIALVITGLFILSSGYICLFVWLSAYSCPLSLYIRAYLGPPVYRVVELDSSSHIDFSDVRLKFKFSRLPENFTSLCNLTGNPFQLHNRSLSSSLLVIVLSAPKKTMIRNAIRQQWASEKTSRAIQNGAAKVFFLMGNGDSENEELAEEAKRHNDIISVDLEDNYMNLVYKVSYLSLSLYYFEHEFQVAVILHIATNMCASSFVLKIDEDVVFNIDRFFDGVDRIFYPKHSSIYCNVWYKMKPKRNENNKWYISHDQFAGPVYPPFCSGSSYAMTTKAAKEILKAKPNFPIIHVEDVLMTGIIAQATHVRRINLPTMFHRKNTLFTQCPKTSYGVRALLSKHNFKSPSAIEKGWKYLKEDCSSPKQNNS